jgi:hypothetical protein
MAGWVTHLPVCHRLQSLHLYYGGQQQQHWTAHPHNLIAMLAQHSQELRSLDIHFRDETQWSASVAGLPNAAEPVEDEWRPTAALATLTGLENLCGTHQLFVKTQGDWQQLVQLTRLDTLSFAVFLTAPLPPAAPQQQQQQQQPGRTLVVLELSSCNVHLGGYQLGCLLLACPLLGYAELTITPPVVPAPAQPPGSLCLGAHSKLQSLEIWDCCSWGDALAAVGHFEALVPVLEHVPDLGLQWWPASSSSYARGGLPDLYPARHSPASPLGLLLMAMTPPSLQSRRSSCSWWNPWFSWRSWSCAWCLG